MRIKKRRFGHLPPTAVKIISSDVWAGFNGYLKEKEVLEHLPHIERSVKTMNKKIVFTPSSCFSCGFIFEGRRRFSRPSRCPRCKKTYIENPMFRIIE